MQMRVRETPFVPPPTASLRRRHFPQINGVAVVLAEVHSALALALTANSKTHAYTSWRLNDSALAAFPSPPPPLITLSPSLSPNRIDTTQWRM